MTVFNRIAITKGFFDLVPNTLQLLAPCELYATNCFCQSWEHLAADMCSDFIALLYFPASSAIVLSKHLQAEPSAIAYMASS